MSNRSGIRPLKRSRPARASSRRAIRSVPHVAVRDEAGQLGVELVSGVGRVGGEVVLELVHHDQELDIQPGAQIAKRVVQRALAQLRAGPGLCGRPGTVIRSPQLSCRVAQPLVQHDDDRARVPRSLGSAAVVRRRRWTSPARRNELLPVHSARTAPSAGRRGGSPPRPPAQSRDRRRARRRRPTRCSARAPGRAAGTTSLHGRDRRPVPGRPRRPARRSCADSRRGRLELPGQLLHVLA